MKKSVGKIDGPSATIRGRLESNLKPKRQAGVRYRLRYRLHHLSPSLRARRYRQTGIQRCGSRDTKESGPIGSVPPPGRESREGSGQTYVPNLRCVGPHFESAIPLSTNRLSRQWYRRHRLEPGPARKGAEILDGDQHLDTVERERGEPTVG